MARKRQRRAARKSSQSGQNSNDAPLLINGQKVRMLNQIEEGTLYDMHITTRPLPNGDPMAKFERWKKDHDWLSAKGRPPKLVASSYTLDHKPPPLSDTFNASPVISASGHQLKRQFTIQNASRGPKKNFLQRRCNIGHANCFSGDTEYNHYQPNSWLFRYINWTFYASFISVFVSFTCVFFLVCFSFGGVLKLAGDQYPECIIVSGEHFGTNPDTKLSDAFALSWTTFTTVGYGMVYTTTGNDFDEGETGDCSLIQFLCTAESFIGLLYAGMCAAILFGKINRVQSHSPVIFSNAVCLQYEECQQGDKEEDDKSEGDKSEVIFSDDGSGSDLDDEDDSTAESEKPLNTFKEQFQGCPVIKFQVINELCNREGAEIVDAIMKVVAIKYKGKPGTSSYSSQYVRVPLIDYEHPFFCRVWHGVHVLDESSPLLTAKAKRDLKTKHHGSWPEHWLNPRVIAEKLEFSDMILTVAGISNVSAVTVHGYKRYKRGDVLIGFDFSPALFQDGVNGRLEVDLSLSNDVMEQNGGGNEELSRGHRDNSSINVKSSKKLFSRIGSQPSGGLTDDSLPGVPELDEREEPSR